MSVLRSSIIIHGYAPSSVLPPRHILKVENHDICWQTDTGNYISTFFYPCDDCPGTSGHLRRLGSNIATRRIPVYNNQTINNNKNTALRLFF